jgi:hypothetical protein
LGLLGLLDQFGLLDLLGLLGLFDLLGLFVCSHFEDMDKGTRSGPCREVSGWRGGGGELKNLGAPSKNVSGKQTFFRKILRKQGRRGKLTVFS